MEKLELYIPKLEDLWFYQKMMSDPETMSYKQAGMLNMTDTTGIPAASTTQTRCL